MEINLPEELVHEILVKLPVKSLLRFRCVCKSWCSLISSSSFTLSHLHHYHEHSVLFKHICFDLDKEFYSLHAENEQFRELETLNFDYKKFSIAGSVNGLICLYNHSYVTASTTLMLWNPSIKKFFILPDFKEQPINARLNVLLYDWCFGFGYDASSNDFKVLMIIGDINKSDNARSHIVEDLVKVFSLNRNSWRTLDCSAPIKMCNRDSCNVGNYVYIISSSTEFRNGFKILSFDLSSEVFTTEIACPEEFEFKQPVNAPKLKKIHDSFALLHEWHCNRYYIWVMRDDGVAKSWMKLVSVDVDGARLSHRIVGFTSEGKMIAVGVGSFVVSPGVEDVGIVKYVPAPPLFLQTSDVHSYKESLFLLKEGVDLPILPRYCNI